MKLIIEKSTIASVMKKAIKVANPKAMIPVLSHVAIDFDGEKCTITANDTNRTYSEMFPAKGEAGQWTVEADKLSRAVNGMRSGDIEITPEHVKQGRSRIKLESLRYADFPQPDYDQADDAGITGEQLAEALATVGHAMGIKDVRTFLQGVHLCEGHAVASDGHRMSFADLPYTGPDLIIPADSVRQMMDLSGQVMVSDRQMVIQSETCRFTTSLVEVKYPDWRRMIPSDFKATASFDASDMIDAIRTAQLGGNTMRLTFGPESVALASDSAESACDCDCDAEAETGFMGQYLIDAIQASGDDRIQIQVGAKGASLINGRFIVMPVRF
jgi:DNA polymerase-3 subunit beta